MRKICIKLRGFLCLIFDIKNVASFTKNSFYGPFCDAFLELIHNFLLSFINFSIFLLLIHQLLSIFTSVRLFTSPPAQEINCKFQWSQFDVIIHILWENRRIIELLWSIDVKYESISCVMWAFYGNFSLMEEEVEWKNVFDVNFGNILLKFSQVIKKVNLKVFNIKIYVA